MTVNQHTMTKQTAIDWFYDKIKPHFEHDGDLQESIIFAYSIAKQKEREQGLGISTPRPNTIYKNITLTKGLKELDKIGGIDFLSDIPMSED